MNRIGKHFTLEELTVSHVKITNVPDAQAIENLKAMVEGLLDPLREAWGAAIRINSGYRSPEVNKAVGGAEHPISQHTKGQVVDLSCSDNAKLFYMIRDHFQFDQLIWEKGNDQQPGWVHVSYKKKGNRNQILKRQI
jgi:zinc D-Ala-D-Ala carboxypeptidase